VSETRKESPVSAFEFNTLKTAVETRDVEKLLPLYGPDATVMVVNKHTTPSRPYQTESRSELETYFGDVCARDITHDVGNEVIGANRVAYTEMCEYPEGSKVFTANYLDIDDGVIVKHTIVETWDE
jgi:hypothetical protein